MKKILGYIVGALMLFGTACEKEALTFAGEYTLGEGFTLSFDDGQLEIHFDEVLIDRRCPVGSFVNCIGPEYVDLLLTYSEDGLEKRVEYRYVKEEVLPISIETPSYNYQLLLTEISPERTIDNFLPDTYAISFELIEL